MREEPHAEQMRGRSLAAGILLGYPRVLPQCQSAHACTGRNDLPAKSSQRTSGHAACSSDRVVGQCEHACALKQFRYSAPGRAAALPRL
jgi:hypothetical protein